MGFIKEMTAAVPSIAKGLRVTMRELFQPNITQQYPDERRVPSPGFRGLPVLLTSPEKDVLNCIACELCAKACPVQCITLVWHKVDRKTANQDEYDNDIRTGKVLDVYELDASHCLYCGLCAEACPFEALGMSDYFEMTDTENPDHDEFVYNKQELGAIGRLEGTDLTGEKFNPYLAVGGIITGESATRGEETRTSEDYRNAWSLQNGEEYHTPNGDSFTVPEKTLDLRPHEHSDRLDALTASLSTLAGEEECLVISDENIERLLREITVDLQWETPINGPQIWAYLTTRR